MEKYLPYMKIVIIIFLIGAFVSFLAMFFLVKKKNRIKISFNLGITIAVLLFILGPVWNDIYIFARNKGYLALKDKYAALLTAFSEKPAILAVRPLYFIPYYPDKPQVEGQRKAQIVAELKIKDGKSAHKIRVKFKIDDGAGREGIDSESWDRIAGQRSLIFSMFYSDVKFVTWTPDIPNDIEAIAKNRQRPFKLWLTVKWEDVNKKEHKIESYSELRYDDKSHLYYFDEIENKLF